MSVSVLSLAGGGILGRKLLFLWVSRVSLRCPLSPSAPLLSPEVLWFWITREKAVARSLNAYGALFVHAVLKCHHAVT